MELFEVIEKRRSIRRYKKDAVPPEAIDKLLEAARLAPSSSNTQSWKFKVVYDAATRAKMKDAAYGQRFVTEAPVVIVCCLDLLAFKEKGKQTLKLVLRGVRPSLEMMMRSLRGGKDKEYEAERTIINGTTNVAIATEHIALAAADLGLGTCWIRAFDQPTIQELLELPEGLVPLYLMTVGYADESPAPRPRKSMDEILIADESDETP
jgi:nitroreductase